VVYNKAVGGLCDAVLAVADGHNGAWASSVLDKATAGRRLSGHASTSGQPIWFGKTSHSSQDAPRSR
jgi:hypothetical protein